MSCIVPGYPPGCRGGFYWEVERPRVKAEEREGFCVVREPVKAVLPRDACEIINTVLGGRLPGHWLFAGPPGTGKSTLMELLARIAPYNVKRVNPEELLSPYVGETERGFKAILEEAAANSPSMIVIDEADMLLSRRSEESRDASGRVAANLVRMLLRFLQEHHDVSVIATTNKPMSEIDPALVRHGRFKVLYFPPPDVKAARLLFELYGREPPGEEELRRVITRALSFSNLVEYIETGRLRRYELNPNVKMIEPVGGCRFRKVPNLLVIAVPPPANVAYAALVAGSLGKPLLLLLDVDYFEDIVWLSKSMGLPVALPFTPRVAEMSVKIVYRLPRVLLLGPEWRDVYRKAHVIDEETARTQCADFLVERDCVELDECISRLVEELLAS